MRRDLTPSQQAVQACHAGIEAARFLFPQFRDVPYLVLCGVRDEKQLWSAFARTQSLGIDCKPFHESDLGGQMTAFATGLVYGDNRRYFRKYQLLKLDAAPIQKGSLS